MADHSKIEWTEATWNPVRGCSIVSPGCTNCYAMKQAHRFSAPGKAYAGLTKMTKGGPVWTGKVTLHHELLDWPLRKTKPLRIFVNSMSDLFHEDVPDEFIESVMRTIWYARQHVFQVLTKRPARMLEWCKRQGTSYTGSAWPPRNLWLGVSVEDQARADERIPLLLRTPAAVRWISAEPLLGLLNLEAHLAARRWRADGRWYASEEGPDGGVSTLLHWVVVGGESGPGARTFDISWARSLRDQCRAVGVPFFMKQLGRYPLSTNDEGYPWAELHDDNGAPIGEWGLDGTSTKGSKPDEWPADLRVREYPA